VSGKPISLAIRFEKHYIPEPNSGCWLWIGATIKSNDALYGVTSNSRGTDEQRIILAHRAFYKLYKGQLPRSMQVDHTCQNTLCVNPEHLEALSAKEHVRLTYDRARHGRCKRGHLMDGNNSWVEKTGQKHCRRCHADREARNRAVKKLQCVEIG
jgi:hypothetical protein